MICEGSSIQHVSGPQTHLSSHDLLCIIAAEFLASSFELALGLQRNLQQDPYFTNSGVDEVEKLWSQKADVPEVVTGTPEKRSAQDHDDLRKRYLTPLG